MSKATVASLEARLNVLIGEHNALLARVAKLEAAGVAAPRAAAQQRVQHNVDESYLVARRAQLAAAREEAMRTGKTVRV